jgi:hypothetical protein
LSPEKIFERNWFLTLFDQALARLRRADSRRPRELFDQLRQFVTQEADRGDYQAAQPG